MGPLPVVNLDKAVEAFLLLQKIKSGGPGGFFFQRPMRSFVTTILLGVAGLDAFNLDT